MHVRGALCANIRGVPLMLWLLDFEAQLRRVVEKHKSEPLPSNSSPLQPDLSCYLPKLSDRMRGFRVNPGDRKRIVYIKGNQDMLLRHIKEPKDGDSDGPTFDVWDSGVDLRITPTIPQTTTKPPPPTAPSGPSHATGPTGTAGYSLEHRPGTLGGPHWRDQTPFSIIDPATQHQQPRTIGRQQGWQTESTLFNATVPTLNERPHLVAHPGPPPMYNDGSSWHPITPTPAAPHSALGVPPYAQVAQHPPMAPHVAPAPSRSSVSGDHQNPTRRPPSHARFQPYTRTPHQSSRKRSSSQPYADILQRDWGYTSIYPEHADDWASQHPAPWGPPTTGTHVQCGGCAAYRAPESDDYSGLRLTMGDASDFRAHTKLQLGAPGRGRHTAHVFGLRFEPISALARFHVLQAGRGSKILLEDQNRANADHGRSFAASAMLTYVHDVRDAPATTPSLVGVSSQLRDILPPFGKSNIARQPPQAPLIHPYSQSPAHTGGWAEEVQHPVAALAPPAYAQTSAADGVARADKVQLLAGTTFTAQMYEPTPAYIARPEELYATSPSWSRQSASTLSSPDARRKTVTHAPQSPGSWNSTYSALEDAVSFPGSSVINP
ncbi:uncharacterized protein TRAVEDRAFT_20456 [Trametes versicolor FP-101664 SS1]|uniref:uncharacterized protein n=1 Tax=Trametes versicolor (strain FP-101664) TaxID=717944 RepID=UPI0004621585|nr:uncharacterized protein TRAVEDRAFT_20456 [Trametes versicolor FP-101664 SS1]EIW58449.1 hypothetical protein TRAVEDRAFT_20456 [Trametes versicolor FP-101664 SS1]